MKLSLACRQLDRTIRHNAGSSSQTYWYRPGNLDVCGLRPMDRTSVQAALAHAVARGDAGLLTEQTCPVPAIPHFSLRQWFRAVCEALAASFPLTR